ncbi:uncharacterized protein LOC118459740 [Anopheles albimanus]|uniref:uncharacterized protein LOC118459740 n=1 Tax=Anopheles albimanus TaxID=7167 RepID=UPI0016408D52|nr:uncharacterized protein LOC118459740 [Anopheles albimanus]
MVGQIVSKPENGHNNERLRLCVFEVAVPIVSSNGLLECWSAIDYGVEKSLLNNNIQVQEEDKNLHGIRSHFLVMLAKDMRFWDDDRSQEIFACCCSTMIPVSRKS